MWEEIQRLTKELEAVIKQRDEISRRLCDQELLTIRIKELEEK
jgi:hypothetical protein